MYLCEYVYNNYWVFWLALKVAHYFSNLSAIDFDTYSFLCFGLFFFPKTLALFVLPSTVSGISGGQFNPSTVYTPDEILTCICKAIM